MALRHESYLPFFTVVTQAGHITDGCAVMAFFIACPTSFSHGVINSAHRWRVAPLSHHSTSNIFVDVDVPRKGGREVYERDVAARLDGEHLNKKLLGQSMTYEAACGSCGHRTKFDESRPLKRKMGFQLARLRIRPSRNSAMHRRLIDALGEHFWPRRRCIIGVLLLQEMITTPSCNHPQNIVSITA